MRDLSKIFTPAWVLDKVAEGLAPHPAPIPKDCGFGWLFENREKVRMLQLMPIKDNSIRSVYNSMDKGELARPILRELDSRGLVARSNEFPYALGGDVSQWLVWVRDGAYTHEGVWQDISAIFDVDEIVTFERNRLATGTLLKGTFPAIRHIHVWTRT